MKYALLGYRLSHSYSPLIQNKLFSIKGIDASYELKEINEDEIPSVLELLRKGSYQGYNVTIPYKKKVMPFLDEISEEAQTIGSVNTIKCVNGRLIGYNTDYFGFKNELKYYNIDVSGLNCYCLGTGGASLAIKKALTDLGANVFMVSRKKNENVITYDELVINKNDWIINTTPVGMFPNTDESPIDEKKAKMALGIVDIIFNPIKTKLMSYNKNSYNGLMMLVLQAAKAQDIWLDKEYDIDYKEFLELLEKEIKHE